MIKLPRIKKRISAFLANEEGSISKKAILKIGAVLTIAALTTIQNSKRVTAHSDHGSHGSHSSHGSHGSHSAHGSHGSHASHGNSLGVTYTSPTATATHSHSAS